MAITGRHILRGHAAFLMALTPTLSILAYYGLHTGRGPYGELADHPLTISGLVQAYPLMGLVGVAMWMGAHGPAPHRFSVLAIAAHCVPFATLAMLWQPILASSIAPAIPFPDPRERHSGRTHLAATGLREAASLKRSILRKAAASIANHQGGFVPAAP